MSKYPNSKYVKCSQYSLWEDYNVNIAPFRMTGVSFDWGPLRLTARGDFLIRSGFEFDISVIPSTPSTLTPALVHDALYTAMKLDLAPKAWRYASDSLFYYMLLDHNNSEAKAQLYYTAVQVGGEAFMTSPIKVHTASGQRWWGAKHTRPSKTPAYVEHWKDAPHLLREAPVWT